MAVSPLASPSATIAVLQRHGLYTKKSLGQHFLVDDNVIARIIALADLSTDDVALEVGPGIGTLTVALCEQAGAVVAVERDNALVPALTESVSDCSRFALVQADAVEVSPDELAAPFGPPSALVANLPYQVAATIVLRFFEMLPSMRQATVMVQSEVADRMAAHPGTKDYGAYTVKLRLRCSVGGRFPVARGCFLPPPRVDSSVIRLDRLAVEHDAETVSAASRVAAAAFAQRRKTIRNSLVATYPASRAAIDRALDLAGVDPSARAETLPPERFLKLAVELSPEA